MKSIKEIKAEREAYEDKHYVVEIDCPEHLTHKVPLYTHGNRFAGIWECEVDGISGSCPHFDTRVEEVEVTVHPDEGQDYTIQIYVCVLCGEQVEGDPREDASYDCD